jgi:transcriptional regulator with XRE-family HTH domain
MKEKSILKRYEMSQFMREKNPEHESLLTALKQTAKARGLNYAEIAGSLGLAEITVKRFFAGHMGSFHHAYAIAEAIGTTLLDAAALAKTMRPPETTLTLEQDAFFAAKPGRYPLFIELYRRRPRAEVLRDWNLSEEKLFRFLRDCERQGLLDLLPGAKIRFRSEGPLLMNPKGKLRESFLAENLKFLEFAQSSAAATVKASEVLLTPKHAEEMKAEFGALITKWRAQAHSDETLLSKSKT